MVKNELTTLRLFSPLFPRIYRRNEWGDIENNPEDLTASEVLEYEDEILALIRKERLPSQGGSSLAVYLDDDLSQKVYSINPLVEKKNNIWGRDNSDNPLEKKMVLLWLQHRLHRCSNYFEITFIAPGRQPH